MTWILLGAIALIATAAYFGGRQRALVLAGGELRSLHSLPGYHGSFVAMWAALPALLLLIVGLFASPGVVDSLVEKGLPADVRELPAERFELFLRDARGIADGDIPSREPSPALLEAADAFERYNAISAAAIAGVVLAISAGGFGYARSRLAVDLRANAQVERTVIGLLAICSTLSILITVGIVVSLIYEATRFFGLVTPTEFLFGLQWSPQTALRADQVGSSGAFGAIPVFAGTALITGIAMTVAVPIGLMSAIYLSEYSSDRARGVLKPLLEILAGIPTVVYGFFAALTVAPLIRGMGESLGLDVASESALAAGLIMGVMIIPFVSSLSDDVIRSVPNSLREGSWGLGATHSETIKRVILPAALPGVVGAVLLAVSRAIGETMIVVMAAGLAANLTANPLEAVTTVTVQIVTLLGGDQEFDSAKTLAAYALGLLLFFITLTLNVIAMTVVRRYQEQYE